MSHWKLGRRHPGCLRCERAFVEGEAHYSLLSILGDRLERMDLCHACWPAEPVVEGAQRAWWRARRPLNHKRGLSVDLEGLEVLFHALADNRSERLLELRYVLALLLLRKRRLFLVRATVKSLGPQSDARGEFLVVRRPRRKEEEFLVQVFDFGPGRIEALRGDLERLFEGIGLEELAAGESGAESQSAGVQVGESDPAADRESATQAGLAAPEPDESLLGERSANAEDDSHLANGSESSADHWEQDQAASGVELKPMPRAMPRNDRRTADALPADGDAAGQPADGDQATSQVAELELSAVATQALPAQAVESPSGGQQGARRARPKAVKKQSSRDLNAG